MNIKKGFIRNTWSWKISNTSKTSLSFERLYKLLTRNKILEKAPNFMTLVRVTKELQNRIIWGEEHVLNSKAGQG